MAATRLDRGQIVDTALRLLNDGGLEGLTLRRLAKELHVQAPALYWHFGSKQALLDEMATRVMRDVFLPPDADEAWQDWLAAACRRLRGTLLGYRDGAKMFSGTHLTDDRHVGGMDRVLAVFGEQGFAPADAVTAFFTAYVFAIGFVIEEQAVRPMPGERDPRYDDLSGREEMFGNYEERFETGLKIIIAGIEALKR